VSAAITIIAKIVHSLIIQRYKGKTEKI